MKNNMYIPGDLVMTNGVPLGTKEGVVYRVTASDPNKTLVLDDGTVLKGTVCLENIKGAELGDDGYLMDDCCVRVKDIVPIPIVPELLEKNGWKLKRGFYNSPNEEGAPIVLTSQTGYGWKAYTGSYHYLCPEINSVSDLQHLLFGLSINSEMEV